MRKKDTRLVAAGTVGVCIFAIIVTALSISATWRMREVAENIYEHPYTVSNKAREMRSRLLDMKQFISIFVTDSFDTEEAMQELLRQRYELQQEAIDVIEERYLGPEEDTGQLQEAMNALIDAQDKMVEFVASHRGKDEQIIDYLQKYVYPYYDRVSEQLTTILNFADSKVLRWERESRATTNMSTTAAVLLAVIIIGLSVHTNRILERKRTRDVAYRERMFGLLSANVDDVFFIYNLREKKLEYVSANSERILGVPEEKFKDRYTLYPMVSKEDVGKLDELFESGLIHMQAEREIRLRKGDGTARWMNIKVYPVLDGGRVSRYIISISDQTERIMMQQNLKDALVVTQNANRAKKDFLSRMSHEIRTPMNAIIGMTTIAAAHIQETERVEDCLSKISFSSRHLLSLINDVLDMSKIEEGKLIVSHEPFALHQLMESLISIVYSQARDKGVEFEASMTGLTEESLVGDSLRVNQILLNLLSNAVKFTPAGGHVRLEVNQRGMKNNQVRLRFSVGDTGIGMSEEFLKRLYTPFEQADENISQIYGGTGLGMSIARNLVTLLGGTIEVRSKIGEGTTFVVELPFGLDQEAGELPEVQKLESLHVLIADDDRDTCVYTATLLDRLGIKAKWVLSGAQAVEGVLEAHNAGEDYDVCFIDWQMPEMDGIETTRRIREYVGPDTLIIIISAYDWSPIEDTARSAGANAFISKPMFASSVYNTLLSVTGKGKIAGNRKLLPEKHHFCGKRILLAEDNMLNREIAEEILKMARAEVECAGNGKEAVDMVLASDKGYYDLVLMDIQMPVMDGYEATRRIRSSSHPDAGTLTILAMTANAFNEDVAAALEAGMDGHIAKPIDANLLFQKLEEIFEKKAV